MKMKYFNYEEFDSPDVQGSGQMMDDEILTLLEEAREIFDKPIIINSGFRTPKHNTHVGGVSTSSHLKGLAVDISCANSSDRFELLQILISVGFNRIGMGNTFIHVDIDTTKSPNVLWTYKNK